MTLTDALFAPAASAVEAWACRLAPGQMVDAAQLQKLSFEIFAKIIYGREAMDDAALATLGRLCNSMTRILNVSKTTTGSRRAFRREVEALQKQWVELNHNQLYKGDTTAALHPLTDGILNGNLDLGDAEVGVGSPRWGKGAFGDVFPFIQLNPPQPPPDVSTPKDPQCAHGACSGQWRHSGCIYC